MRILRRLPLSELKIDRSFVAGMANNVDDAASVVSTVDLAESLGLRTVAEGVEDRATRTLLNAIGCTAAQGWNIARPMPADQLVSWLSEHAPRSPDSTTRSDLRHPHVITQPTP